MKPKQSSFAITDMLLVGLLLAGGAENYVDIEHVAYACYRIAPTQFRWRLYNYPSLEAVQRGVGDLKKIPGEEMIRKPKGNSTERMLTRRGIERAMLTASRILGKRLSNPRDIIAKFKSKLEGDSNKPDTFAIAVGGGETRPAQRDLRNLRRHRIFQRWLSAGSISGVERWEVADLLSCLPDSAPEIWQERIDRLKAQALWWNDDEIMRFISDIQAYVDIEKQLAEQLTEGLS